MGHLEGRWTFGRKTISRDDIFQKIELGMSKFLSDDWLKQGNVPKVTADTPIRRFYDLATASAVLQI